MFDYSARIEAFRDQRIRLSAEFEKLLLNHRRSNRDRLIARLPSFIEGVTLGESSFRPQGSFAMQTVIQNRFVDDEYDIDDGLVLHHHQLKNKDGTEMTSDYVRGQVREALKDKRFSRQPRFCSNCVRVFYADTDKEKHHVDFPIYRVWLDRDQNEQRELANERDWIPSDPTAVNQWFNSVVLARNLEGHPRGTQFRHLIQLLKRFCRSRKEWDLPNGMKLSMLVSECQGPFSERIDEAFRVLLTNLKTRLRTNKQICNLAAPGKPPITRTSADQNVVDLENRITEALDQLSSLDDAENGSVDDARKVWNWIFKSEGFFAEYDENAVDDVLTNSANSRSMFNVPWRDRPTWEMRLTHRVILKGEFANANNAVTWTPFENDGPPIKKHLYLRFRAETDAPLPYDVFWQVVNTGNEALQVSGGGRGSIEEAHTTGTAGLVSTSATRLMKPEQSLYSGSHWIECFLVRGRVCFARSGPFVVNIE